MFLALAAFLSGWIGLAVLVVYAFVIGALFEDDWWFRGLLFLAVPFGVAYGLGLASLPGLTEIGVYFGVYALVGVVWSFFKWILFCTDLKKLLKEKVSETKNWTSLSNEEKGKALWGAIVFSKFSPFIDRDAVVEKLNVAPHLGTWQNKAKVFNWIAYWPFSVINYIFDRLIRDLVDWVIESLKGIYNAIAANIMRGLQF